MMKRRFAPPSATYASRRMGYRKQVIPRNPRSKGIKDTLVGNAQGVGASIDNTGVVYTLSDYALGVGESERNGRHVYTNSILFNLRLGASATMIDVSGCMTTYHWLIYDKDVGTSEPSVSDIFSWANQENCASYMVKRSVSDRFKVLRKWRWIWKSSGIKQWNKDSYKAGTVYPSYVPCHKYFKGLRLKTEFMDKQEGTYGNIKSGAILWVIVNDKKDTQFYATVGGIVRRYFNG